MGLLDYYPNEAYISKKWKPEQVSSEDLEVLARAEKLARKTGVLHPSVADKFLANALVEGRFSGKVNYGDADYGMNTYGYPVAPYRTDMMRKMGLTIGNYTPLQVPPDYDSWDIGQLDAWEELQAERRKAFKYDIGIIADNPDSKVAHGGYMINTITPEVSAKMAAIMLAEKAKLYGNDKAIERWNGKGKKIVRGKAFADANNHAQKVLMMQQMLNNPVNANILRFYRGLLD